MARPKKTTEPSSPDPKKSVNTFDVKIINAKGVHAHKSNPHATEGEVLEILSLFNFEPLSGLIGVYGSENDLYNLIIS